MSDWPVWNGCACWLVLVSFGFMSMRRGTCNQPVKLVVGFEIHALRTRKFIHPPEPGVMARGFVFPAGVAQPDDQFDGFAHNEKTRHAPFDDMAGCSGCGLLLGCGCGSSGSSSGCGSSCGSSGSVCGGSGFCGCLNVASRHLYRRHGIAGVVMACHFNALGQLDVGHQGASGQHAGRRRQGPGPADRAPGRAALAHQPPRRLRLP